MKHHVLLGLILGLLATAKLGGGEPPVLFNVEFEGNIVRINTLSVPVINVPTPASLVDIQGPSTFPVTSGYGITLLNLFEFTYDPGSSPLSGSDIQLTRGSGENQITASLNSFEFAVGSIANPGSVINYGQNLTLFGGPEIDFSVAESFSLTGGRVLTFTTATAPSVPNSTNSQNGTGYIGPLYVYAGLNNAYGGDSLIGTYTVTVVPEPSTYAAIAGGLGLVAAVLHRRRQRARASAA